MRFICAWTRLAFGFVAFLFCCALTPLLNAQAPLAPIADSINASANPVGNAWFGAPTAGWNYTPSSSYLLSGVFTRFGALGPTGCNGLPCPASITVVVEDSPGGNVLASASFAPLFGSFSGGSFASPVQLTAGVQYFIGFQNVDGVPANVTTASGATSLGSFYTGVNFNLVFSNFFTAQPILEFTTLVPGAGVTYTYTGNSFTSVGGNIGATLSNHISITFSVANALAPNLNCATIETGGAGSLLSFFMTDGVNNYGLASNTTVQCISTSATGQITQWSVGDSTAGSFPFIVSTNIPSTGNVNDVSALTTSDFASVRNNPGTWSQGPAAPTGCPVSVTAGSTIDFTDRAAFAAATTNSTKVGFANILPPGEQFGGYSQLDVPGVSFSTPIPGTFVNITTAGFYSPNVYPADFIVDSVNQSTGQPNPNNSLCVSLTQPTFAVGLDLGGLGFSGTGSGTITLSNGHTFSISNLPTVGNTTFVGFISTQPIASLTFATTNDSWVVEDLLTATPIINNCSLSLAPTAVSFPAQGGGGSFQVNTGAGCTWGATFNAPWIVPPIHNNVAIVGGFPPPTGPGSVRFSVIANPTTSARTGTISVGNQTFTVNQAGLSCNATLNPSTIPIDASSQSIRVVVKDGPSCSWTAASNAGWLTITAGGAGTGNGSVYIQASANSGGARTGTVTIAGQTLTVQQAAPVQNACGATDVTSMVAPIVLGQKTPEPYFPNSYTQSITIINRSSSVLHAPLWLVLVGVPNHRPSPFDVKFNQSPDGQTTCFDPAGSGMFEFTSDLAPGHQLTITPVFFVDSSASLSYTPKLLSGTPSK